VPARAKALDVAHGVRRMAAGDSRAFTGKALHLPSGPLTPGGKDIERSGLCLSYLQTVESRIA